MELLPSLFEVGWSVARGEFGSHWRGTYYGRVSRCRMSIYFVVDTTVDHDFINSTSWSCGGPARVYRVAGRQGGQQGGRRQ